MNIHCSVNITITCCGSELFFANQPIYIFIHLYTILIHSAISHFRLNLIIRFGVRECFIFDLKLICTSTYINIYSRCKCFVCVVYSFIKSLLFFSLFLLDRCYIVVACSLLVIVIVENFCFPIYFYIFFSLIILLFLCFSICVMCV